ncbi:Protein TIFY 3B, partial [Mucuna pruriens]
MALAGVNPDAGGGWKAFPSVMDNSVDDGSLMHFSATRTVSMNVKLMDNFIVCFSPPPPPFPFRPVASSGENAAIPSPTQFTILYKGKLCIYDGIPAGKVREIMMIASTSAKSAEMKSGIPLTSLIPTNSSSQQGNSTNLASPQSVCFPAKKSSICRLQDEFPIARRQSLQRFLEKRRNRLGNKAPYASSGTKVVNNIDHSICADKTPDFGSLNYQRRDFSPVLLPL